MVGTSTPSRVSVASVLLKEELNAQNFQLFFSEEEAIFPKSHGLLWAFAASEEGLLSAGKAWFFL